MKQPGICLYLLRRRHGYETELGHTLERLTSFPPLDLVHLGHLHRLIHTYRRMIGSMDRLSTLWSN